MNRYFTESERNKLYKEVWVEPMTNVCKRYSISNVALKKRCIKMQIPTPPPGYWTTVRSGGQVERPPLPKQNNARRKTIDNIEGPVADEPLFYKDDPLSSIININSRLMKIETAYNFVLSKNYVNYHGLVSEAAKWLKSPQSTSSRYLRTNHDILDMKVTEKSLNRSLKIMDTIIRVIEELGAVVILEDKSTYVNIKNIKIKICIEEIYFKRTNRNVLALHINDMHANRHTWSDNDSKPIEENIPQFICELYNTADSIKLCQENESEYHDQLLKKDREMARFRKLEEAAIDWQRSQVIENYIRAIEQSISNDMEKQFDHFEWLEWAKCKVEWLNPLIGRSDHILGKKHKNIFDDHK